MSSRRPAPRPKRAGEAFARTHQRDSNGPASKKPRFDVRNPSALAPEAAEEEDVMLELDEIGKGGQQTKRNAVNIDGYESDSSNEGFDARAEAKAEITKAAKGNGKKDAEVMDDMFGDLEEEVKNGSGDDHDDKAETSREARKNKKNVRFLAMNEIEGQEASSKGGSHISADFRLKTDAPEKEKYSTQYESSDSDSDSDSDEDKSNPDAANDPIDEEIGLGGKKKHAPKVSAFHMKDESEEGMFDDQGNFVRRAADPDAVHDTWLEGISKKEQKRAREAEEKREEERRRKNLADAQVLTSDVLGRLIPALEKGETVLEGLARLAKNKKTKKKRPPKIRNGKGDDGMDLDDPPATTTTTTTAAEVDALEIRRREAVETITGAADHLLTTGQTDIYEATREMLMRQYARETGDDWTDTAARVTVGAEDGEEQLGPAAGTAAATAAKQTVGAGMWEYRWTDERDGGERHGPFQGEMMEQWRRAGFFAEGVEFRRVEGLGEWSRVVGFV